MPKMRLVDKEAIGAWNRNRKVWVKWLGVTETLDDMNSRIKSYRAPIHISPRLIPKSSRWLRKRK